GLLFREAYPRRLAAALFSVGVGKVLGMDVPAGGEAVSFAGWTLRPWTPTVALAGVLFYINRALRSADLAYGYAASAMFLWVIAFETPERYLALAWFAFAAGLFAFGWLRRLTDFRLQGYGASILALGAVGVHQLNIASGLTAAPRDRWLPLVCSALLSYAG